MLTLHSCNRCQHEWYGRLENPRTCANPKCRTPYWNKARIRKQVKKTIKEKFHFYFEIKNPDQSYSFTIIENEIICNKCNNRTCNHVFEIMTNPKIREQISQHEIEFSSKYEAEIKELEKNVKALTEFVQQAIIRDEV